MKSVLIFFVIAPVFGAEPKTIGEAEMTFNKEFNTAKEEFDAKVKVAQDKFTFLLKEEMKRLTAKGDLDGAVAIREKIKTFEVVETSKIQSMVGKWKVQGVNWTAFYTFHPNGTITTIFKDKIYNDKIWEINKDILTIYSKNGKERLEWYKLPILETMNGKEQKGASITLLIQK
jgi:hypothetical protein